VNLLEIELRGTQVLEASAGTGKTHAITTLFLRLLLEERWEVDRILVVTYTNAATAELRRRLRARLSAARLACGCPQALPEGDSDLRELLERRRPFAADDQRFLELALQRFDEAPISTIHGFCQRVLVEHAFETGVPFASELLASEEELREEILRDFWIARLHGADPELLMALEREGFSFARARELLREVVGRADLVCLPREVPPIDPERTAAALEALEEARRLFSEHRAEIRELLLASPLYRRRGGDPAARIDGLLRRFEAACAESRPGVSIRFPELEELRDPHRGARLRHPFFEACQRLWDAEEPWRLFPTALRVELVRYAREEAARRKARRRVLSFEDLLLRVRDALRGPHGERLAERIRSRTGAALVDEFQDTDPVQYEIFERIWHRAGAPLVFVGDPKQAIYGFRGADVFTYLAARRSAQQTRHLHVNRRSDPSLVRALNTLFEAAPDGDAFSIPEIAFHRGETPPGRTDAFPGEAALEVLVLDDSRLRGRRGPILKTLAEPRLPAALAGEVVRFLSAGRQLPSSEGCRPVQPGDIAVLCRTNFEALQLQQALSEAGVPAAVRAERSVLASEEARELAAVLRAMAEPSEPRRVRAALATSLFGATAHELEALDRDERRWDETVSRFAAARDDWQCRGVLYALKRLFDEHGVAKRLLGLPRGERRLTNTLHVAELLHWAESALRRGPLELLDWLVRALEQAERNPSRAPEENQLRLETDDSAVTVVTVHKAKGLEWPVVFCPYLWIAPRLDREGFPKFHHPELGTALDLRPDSEESRRLAEAELRSEALRLLYVALTRARHRVVVVWVPVEQAEASPLARFLLPPGAPATDLEALRRRLAELARQSQGAIGCRSLPLEGSKPWRPESSSHRRLSCRSFSRTLDTYWRGSSFSALIATEGETPVGGAAMEADYDAVAAPPVPAEGASSNGTESLLAEFPAGPRAGVLVHRVLERIDFRRTDPDELGRVVEAELRASGFERRLAPALEAAIASLLANPLVGGEAKVRLGEVPRQRRISEMEFTLPVGFPDGRPTLSPHALASLFERFLPAGIPRAYPASVRELGFPALAGYLRGSIDLVCEQDGRFWLFDWKSNHLGRSLEDYRTERLATVMAEHHYVLQYHLYVAALDRYLRRRLRGYDYERHFGGVFYVFLRGLDPSRPDSGVFFDRPAAKSIARLQALLTGGGSAAPEDSP
jgi:exodeoxyribonuclease V beta subunit